MLLPPFCVLRDGEPIESVPLRYTVRTNIAPNDVRLDLGLISEFEEREASVFAGRTWSDWCGDDVRDRAASVAHMRYHHLINSHVSEIVRHDGELKDKQRRRQQGQGVA